MRAGLSTRNFLKFVGRPTTLVDIGAGALTMTAIPSLSSSLIKITRNDIVAAVEIELDSGTVRLSHEGVNVPTFHLDEALISIGIVSRQVPVLGSVYRGGDALVVVDNKNNEFSKLKAAQAFRNRTLRIKIGSRQLGYNAMRTIFSGKISTYDNTAEQMSIKARDTTFDRFESQLQGKLNITNFPTLPADQKAYLQQIIYGQMSSAVGSAQGAVPAYRIDANITGSGYIYLAARRPLYAITAVYNYGILMTGGYSVETRQYAGQDMQVIVFSADPQDINRPDEFEITFDADGFMDDNGDLIENPVEQIRDYFLNYAEVDTSELSDLLFDEASGNADTENYKGAWAVVGQERQHLTILREFSESFNVSLYPTGDGLIGCFLFSQSDVLDPISITRYTHTRDILNNTFKFKGGDLFASRVQYNHVWNPVKDYFEKQPRDISSSLEEARQGGEKQENFNLWYVRDTNTAVNVGVQYLQSLTEGQEYVEHELGLQYYRIPDLHKFYKLTTLWGVAADGLGYVDKIFRTIGINIDPNPFGSIKLEGVALVQFSSQIIRETPMGVVDGSNGIFQLAELPIGGSVQVFLNEFFQIRNLHYTISGNVLVFTIPPVPGDRVRVHYGMPAQAEESFDFVDMETPSGTIDGSNKNFTLANTPLSGSLDLFLSEFFQEDGVHYTLSGTTIAFEIAPQVGQVVRAFYRKTATTPPTALFVDNEEPVGAVDSSNKDFTLTYTPAVGTDIMLFLGEFFQVLGVHYTRSGKVISFVLAPSTGSEIRVWYKKD